MRKDIFDLLNVDDLPSNLKNQVSIQNLRSINLRDCILLLFKLKNELTLLEIQCALYRKNWRTYQKSTLVSTMSRLKKEGFIKNKSFGVYILNEGEKKWLKTNWTKQWMIH